MEGVGDVGRAVICEDAFDFDPVGGVEADGLAECSEDGGDFFVIEDTGVAESRVVIDGHVERFVASALVAVCSVAGAAYAWFMEAGELLHIEVKEVAGMVAFISHWRWFWCSQ